MLFEFDNFEREGFALPLRRGFGCAKRPQERGKRFSPKRFPLHTLSQIFLPTIL
jgi:hypothetical protein